MRSEIHWGIIGPGPIAVQFSKALRGVEGAVCHSVCGRDLPRAQTFAEQNGFAVATDALDTFLNDEALDVVYIATPHSEHERYSLACLAASKAVLCEKPATVNAAQFDRVRRLANERQVFYMEAVWTRFLPVYETVKQWITAGEIGAVRSVSAAFGLHRPYDPEHRLFNPDLAGGALLDVGIYPLTLADMVFDQLPEHIQALGSLTPLGVDERVVVQLAYADGAVASLRASIQEESDYTAWIEGDQGRIRLASRFWCTQAVDLFEVGESEPRLSVHHPHSVNGYEYEILEVHRCLQQRLIESSLMPHATTARLLQLMDRVREQLGVRYACAGE